MVNRAALGRPHLLKQKTWWPWRRYRGRKGKLNANKTIDPPPQKNIYIYIYNISKYTIAFATKFVCKFWLQVHVWKTGPWMLGAKLAAMPWCCFGCKTLQVQVWNRPLNVEGQASSYAYRCCFVGPCVPNFFGIALAQEKMCDTCTCACGCKVPYGSGASRQERTCNSYLLNNGHCNDVIPCDHVHGGASLWSVLKHISKIF